MTHTLNNNEFASTETITVMPPLQNKAGIFSFLPFDFFNSLPIIAVLRLQGVIGKVGIKGGLTLESVNESIEKAFTLPKLTALCLIMSPALAS